MTTLQENDRHVRSELELAAQQLRAIERFTRARRLVEDAAVAAARSRELRMDAARGLEVSRRQQQALIARTHEQLRASGDILHGRAECRAVVAHRNAWFTSKLADALQSHGVRVVAHLDNGADAIGTIVAEQPDLVLVEDALAMVSGEQVVREIREYCAETRIGAQVAYSDRVDVLLGAGASTVFTRQVPPAEVARDLLALISA